MISLRSSRTTWRSAQRAARGFQPNRKVERLLTQFVASLPPDHSEGQLFTQGDALAWAHDPVGGSPSWLPSRLSAVRQFAAYRPGPDCRSRCRQPVKEPAGGSRRVTPYLYTNPDVCALMRAAEDVEIARLVGVSRPTVNLWRSRYIERGLAGLADVQRSGRKRSIDQRRIVAETLRPPPAGLG